MLKKTAFTLCSALTVAGLFGAAAAYAISTAPRVAPAAAKGLIDPFGRKLLPPVTRATAVRVLVPRKAAPTVTPPTTLTPSTPVLVVDGVRLPYKPPKRTAYRPPKKRPFS